MPSSGGGGNSTTTVQKADPWSGQQPYLNQQFQQAQNLYNTGMLAPGYYPGQTVANQSPQTQQAIQGITKVASGPQPITDASQHQLTDTLNGKYLDPSTNPGFQQALTDIQKAYSTGTAAQTDAAFNRSGAYGGSAYDETKQMQNKAYADSMNTLAGNMYQQGRQQQMQGLLTAPSISGMSYTPYGQLANAGQTQDTYNQGLINADIGKYNYNANLPQKGLQNYIGLTGGQYGSTNTTTQPYQSSNLGLGLGLGASMLGSSMSGAGSAGGLLGAFGLGGGGGGGAAAMTPALWDFSSSLPAMLPWLAAAA